MIADWSDTELWRLLESRGSSAELTRDFVRPWLSEVQTLLAKVGTAPLDFTLHDDQHSFRVAQRMVQLIPDSTLRQLSDFELGLLLQAAYLHDIGMNPRRDVVSQIRNFLFTGNKGDLDPAEASNLQRWLDESHPGTSPPVAEGQPDALRLYRAEYFTAYFCRHRHNDWSEKFISEKADSNISAPYPNWFQDLVVLCKSHHHRLQELMDPALDLRIAGARHQLINLRYLAAVLRVADILEFDPERTPEVVFNHRQIDAASKIYWYKDHSIVLAVEKLTRLF